MKRDEIKTTELKFIFLLIFSLFLIIIFYSQQIRADVISINAGGDNNTAVTPSNYIENFFSGIENAVGITPPPPPPPPPPGGGGGGAPPANISLNPSEFNINLAVNTTTERTITVTNTGTTPVTVFASSNLPDHIILNPTNLTIAVGQSATVKATFVASSKPGIYTGIITIGGMPVLVSINVKTTFLLFDSNIVVLNPNYQVQQGDQLLTQVTLIPLGSQENTDVTLVFTIRDYNSKIFLTKSETMMINKLTTIDRNFDTGTLPPGKYVVGLQLTYGTSVAPSSAHFEVTKKKSTIVSTIILYLILLILLIMILILIILIWRRIKKMREEEIARGAEFSA
ncbi:MAG: hypothetical protein ABSG05_00025 [Candidatus Pacearchaeota archaeon]|jgi:hypothetical protein